ncbi:MAG: RnfABCDGE type electron transport complex subunit D [Mangrovicoccus sp.]|nr:RnfABCDGE type electron transport complex subunit D [Mangrovicoccus sp.]
MNIPAIISGPHTHSRFSVTETMFMVMICLSPATAMGFYLFGWPALFLFAVTLASALVFEALCLMLARKPVHTYLFDGSALLTAWILAMTLPPWAPWWVAVVGAFLAIVVGKHVYGGLGQNMFNPAMVARAALLIALPVEMTQWIMPVDLAITPGFGEALAITFGTPPAVDAYSGASALGYVTAELSAGRPLSEIMGNSFDVKTLFFGNVSGSLGETSALLILAGGILLMAMRLITWHIPLSVLAGAATLSGALYLANPEAYPSPFWHLTSGAMMLTAFFIATDYVTSPASNLGRVIYGAAIGALIVIIRTFGSFPEGAAFAVLLLNGCVPLIDEYTRPRIFGRTRSGKPLEIADE